MRRAPIVAIAVASLAAACSGSSANPTADSSGRSTTSDPGPATTEPDPTTPPSTAPVPPPPVGVPDGAPIVDGTANSLVLVLDAGSGTSRSTLVSYRADGTEVAAYTTEDDSVVWQPIWSPDGRRVAWTTTSDGTSWELVTNAVDGTDRTTHPLPGRPDYIAYDPTASRVLALTPSTEGFGLVIVDVGTPSGGGFDVVDIGQPYFSDFAPDGTRVVAHVGSDLRVVPFDGEAEPIDGVSVRHQTPAWHPSEELVFVAVDDDTGNRLVRLDLDTDEETELATFDTFVLFDLDPDGTRLAVSSFDAGDDGLEAAAGVRRQTPDRLGSGLWVVDVGGGPAVRLAERPTVAPMWDPTGTRVLVRTAISGVGRWDVYDADGARTGTEDVDVGATLLPAYLPFWDQYARSQTLWSPDGELFVHAGRSAGGEAGIWIHDAHTAGPSTLLVPGDLAFWSPT